MGKSFLLASVIFLSQNAQAGGASTGGGKGVLCNINSAATLSTLELYEAENVFHQAAAPLVGDLDAEVLLGFERLEQTWAEPGKALTSDQIKKYVATTVFNEFYSKMSFIPKGTSLPMTKDATIPVVPTDCEIVQIAIYNSLGIQLDEKFWNLLTPRNKAALIFHEALYHYRRAYGATSSDEVRRFVGEIYSLNPPTPRYYGIPKSGYYTCHATGAGASSSRFIAYPSNRNSETGFILSFSELNGATTLGRTAAFIAGSFASEILAPDSSSQGSASANITSETNTLENQVIRISRNANSTSFNLQIFDSEGARNSSNIEGQCEIR